MFKKKNVENNEVKPSFLNKEINLSDFKNLDVKDVLKITNKKKNEYPSKDIMNLYFQIDEKKKKRKNITFFVVLGILLIVFLVFGILKPLLDIHNVKVDLQNANDEYLQLQTQLKNYAEIKEEYYRYSDDFMTDSEAALVDREAVIDIVDVAVEGFGDVVSLNITGNRVSVIVYTPNLDNVSAIRKQLEDYECIKNVAVYSSTKGDGENVSVNSSVVFNVDKTAEVLSGEQSAKMNSGEGTAPEDIGGTGDSDYENTNRTGGE